jgi:membrane fusion protein (multidrug efflux system)
VSERRATEIHEAALGLDEVDGAAPRNAVTVVVPEEHAARVEGIRRAAVWIDVAVVATLADAPADRKALVIGDPEHPPDDPRVAHVIRAATPDDQLHAVMTAIATGASLASPAPVGAPTSPQEARAAQAAFTVSRKLATATDLLTTEAVAIECMIELLDVERAHCLFFDADSGSLWSEAKQRGAGDERVAIGGMVGWSARTGLASTATIAGDDPRYVADIDDPDGDPASQILVQPIIGADARVHAVLVAVRRTRRSMLGPMAASVLAKFAALAAPLLDQLSTHVEGQQLLEADGPGGESLFSDEAVANAAPRAWGDVVRVSPAWLSWAYWALVLMLIGSVAFAWFGTIYTYSTGPAVIRSTARTSVTVRSAGNISTVDVVPGERVTAGGVIARLDDVDQRHDVDRLTSDLETALRNHLFDPNDAAADSSVRALRLQLEQARNTLDERVVRASRDGEISDLRVRPGQRVAPGDIAASIVEGNGGLEVVALLPGEDRPQLAPGMTIRLELSGYRYSYQQLVIDSVSPDVIAPSEAKRMLGTEVDIQVGGPVVLVRGRLVGKSFESDGETYDYHDGMIGIAEVRVRSERVLVAIVPGLRKL